VNSMGVLFIYL
jgi:hypothetical protein